MSFFNHNLEKLDIANLQYLVDNKIPEGRDVEYKQLLDIDSNRKEFLNDVSSFANASGGYLLYGIKAIDGVPTEICGLDGIIPDQEMLKCESVIRDSIEPRLIVHSTAVKIAEGKCVLIIKIPKSWNAPHVNKSGGRFFSRNSAGKYPLDIYEIKNLVQQTDKLKNKMDSFQNERLALYDQYKLPIKRDNTPKLIVHSIPLSFEKQVYDLSGFGSSQEIQKLFQGAYFYHQRYNYAGYLGSDFNSPERPVCRHVQVFRNGSIEFGWSIPKKDQTQRLYVNSLESYLIGSLELAFQISKYLELDPPLVFFVALLDVRMYQFAFNQNWFEACGHPIDKNDLVMPETVVNEFGGDIPFLLKPVIDSIWNAAGYSKSYSFRDGLYKQVE